jgi:hypothetical protein
MAKPYGYGLRQKVIQAIQLDGLKISEVCLIFNISRHTIRLWLKRQLTRLRQAGCDGQLFAPFTVEGSCNRTVFETWLETCLIPMLKPGQVVIADQATFHKGGAYPRIN